MHAQGIARVKAYRLHGIYDLDQPLDSRVNVIYGHNGVGKTTLLHIVANGLAGDFSQFLFLQFDQIELTMFDNTSLLIERHKEDEGTVAIHAIRGRNEGIKILARFQEAEKPGQRGWSLRRVFRDSAPPIVEPIRIVSYFPAFRSMMDAWEAAVESGAVRPQHRDPSSTAFARKLFGQFVPELSYPSLTEIEAKIEQEASNAYRDVALAESQEMVEAARQLYRLIPGANVPVRNPASELIQKVSGACSEIQAVRLLLGQERSEEIADLEKLIRENYSGDNSDTSQTILQVYSTALSKISKRQHNASCQLKYFLDAVNNYLGLDGKRIAITAELKPRICYDHNSRKLPLKTLSSGERQIVTMIHEVTHLSSAEIVLIDEPELSLHVDWQRSLIADLSSELDGKQVIVATHSPVIGRDLETLQQLELAFNPFPEDPDPLLAWPQVVRYEVTSL